MANQTEQDNATKADEPGLVISYFGNSVAVETENGQVFQCHLHRNQTLPVVGDRVTWQLDSGDTGVITAILPRKTELIRCDDRGRQKVVAANIDVIVVVMSPPPGYSSYLVDRYLMAAALLNIQPVIVVNKVDLLDDAQLAALKAILLPYQQASIETVLASTYQPGGLTALQNLLANRAAVLVGPSGVGKSSIISALSAEDIRVQEVSPKGVGKHTTTATRLYHLPQGGCLIDSPGVREFNLWPVEQAEILRGFAEFQPFLGNCRFRDCIHVAEPGCGVQEAVASGKIGQARYASYQTLMREVGIPKKRC